MGSCAIVIFHFRYRSDPLEVAGKNGLRQCRDAGQGRDIPADSAPVVRLMLGKFTLAGIRFSRHWRQEPMAQTSNILEGCHSISRRAFFCRVFVWHWCKGVQNCRLPDCEHRAYLNTVLSNERCHRCRCCSEIISTFASNKRTLTRRVSEERRAELNPLLTRRVRKSVSYFRTFS